MKKLFLGLAAVFSIAALGSTTACERLVTEIVHDTVATHDTTFINKVTTKVDTVTLTRVDTVVHQHFDTTVVTKLDTIIKVRVDTAFILKTDTVFKLRVDTVVVPIHDTTFVQKTDTLLQTVHDTVLKAVYDTTILTKYDTITKLVHDTTFVPKTDTLYLPGQVTHDTTWVYTQTNPTNPLAGGDPNSGLMALQVLDSYFVVFWHGHFVGVLRQGSGTGQDGTFSYLWYAYLSAKDGSMIMPLACAKPTWQEAAGCLEPLILTLHLDRMPFRELKQEARAQFFFDSNHPPRL